MLSGMRPHPLFSEESFIRQIVIVTAQGQNVEQGWLHNSQLQKEMGQTSKPSQFRSATVLSRLKYLSEVTN